MMQIYESNANLPIQRIRQAHRGESTEPQAQGPESIEGQIANIRDSHHSSRFRSCFARLLNRGSAIALQSGHEIRILASQL